MFGAVMPSHAQLIINEIMQSNIDCVMDDINEFPDSWVELYNAGSTAVNLDQYKLGITDNPDEAWQLPSRTIGSHQYFLLYCDKEDTGLHAPYRIDSGKSDGIWLFQNGKVADSVLKLKKQPAPNIAYGRKDDGGEKWGYQATPTPGKANCGKLCSELLGNPVFSSPGKVLKVGKAVRLTISLPEGAPEGTVIRYTTDGSEPTASSPEFSSTLMLRENTVIRAKLFCDGYLSPRSVTQSYIFFPTNRELTLPVISIATDDKYLNDPKIGIYVDGTYQSGKKNFEFDWRRPINFEYFEVDGDKSALNQLCETRIQGGATRTNPLKSLAIYANKRFGEKRFSYEFFPDQKPGLTEFKSIVLRNAGNDFDYLYMRDIIAQRTMASHADLDWQAWRPVIVYINGEYKGIENIRERSNEDNIYTNYDGLEDLDMIENWWDLKEGTWDHFNAFKAFFGEHDHKMAEYEKWVDCQEFINLMAMNIYYNNIDFPGNNIVLWRPRTDDGRWRFIAKDVDYTMHLYNQCDYNYQYLNWLYDKNYDGSHNWGANDYEDTRLFRRLMEDEDFNREFIDHMAVYMGDFLNYEGTWKVWEPMYNQIKTEYPHHRKLFNEWWPNYQEQMNIVKTWLQKRTNFMYQHLADYYKLEAPMSLSVNTSLKETDRKALQFTFNGVPLSEGKFDGKFYKGRTVTLSSTPAGGQQVVSWTVVTVASTTTTSEYSGPSCSFDMPSCTKVIVNAKLGATDGIDQQSLRKWTWQISDNQLQLSNIPARTRVALYDLQGILLSEAEGNESEITLPLTPQRAYVLKVGGESIKIKH